MPVLVISEILIIGHQYYSRTETKKRLALNAAYIIVTTLLIISFYSAFGLKSSGLAGVKITSPIELFIESLTNVQITTQVNILVGGLIHLLLFYLPILPMLYLFLSLRDTGGKGNSTLKKHVLIVIMVSLFGWAFLYKEINSNEIYLVMTVPLLNSVFAIMAITMLNKMEYYWNQKKILFLFSGLMTTAAIVVQIINSLPDEKIERFNTYSNSYLKRVRSVIDSQTLKLGASIKDESMLQEPHLKYSAVYPLGDYLTLMDESVAVVNIGDFNTPIDSSSSMNYERSIKSYSRWLVLPILEDQGTGRSYAPDRGKYAAFFY